jgi:hypothetical protein
MATLLNSTILLNELVMRFQNNLKAGKLARHAYDAEFAKGGKYGKKGETIGVREPHKFVVTESATLTATSLVETKKDIKCDTQAHAAFQLTSRELTMNIDSPGIQEKIDGCAVALANHVDVAILTKAYKECPNWVGTAGVTPDEFLTYLEAGEALDRNACPSGTRYAVINPAMNTAIINELKGLLVPSKEVGAQFLTGRMGNAAGLEFLMDQNVRTHTAGLQGTGAIQVNATVAATQSTLAIKGLLTTTGTVTAGSKFTVAGVYAVNPITGDSLAPILRQFTVQNLETPSGGIATLDVYPEINITAPNATVTAYPVEDAVVTFASAPSATYANGIVAHPEAFQWASVPLETPSDVTGKTLTDPDTGISMRMLKQYAIGTDIEYWRVDIMFGVAAIRPEWACVVLGR